MKQVIFLLIVLTCHSLYAQVRLEDSGDKPVTPLREDRREHVKRTIILRNSVASYEIRCERYVEADGSIGGDPNIAAVQVNHLYSAPAFSFNVREQQGASLSRRPFSIETREGALNRKSVMIRWQIGEREVELTLALHEDRPELFCRFSAAGDALYTVHLNMAPGGYCPKAEDRDRRMLLPEEDVAHDRQTRALPQKSWLLLYDTKLAPGSNPHAAGAFGLAWVAPEGASIEGACNEYISPLSITVPSGGKPVLLAFRSFARTMNEEAMTTMRRDASGLIDELASNAESLFDIPKKITIRKPR